MSYGNFEKSKLLKLRYVKVRWLKITKLFWTTFNRLITRNKGWEVNSVNSVLFLSKNVPLVSTSSRKFKTCQPGELQLFNISPLMEVCSSPLATIKEIFRNTKQAPWFTRWMNRLKSSHCTRPCKLEVHMALSTFLSLINISLLWLIIMMVRTNLTL